MGTPVYQLNKVHNRPGTHSTFSSFELGIKYSFMNMLHSRLHSAIGLEVEVPTVGDEGIGYEPTLMVSQDLLNDAQLFAQIGAECTEEEWDMNLGFGIFFPLGDFALTCEFNRQQEEDEGRPSPWYFTPGFEWLGELNLGLAFPFVLGAEGKGFSIAFMVIYEFETR